MCQDLAVAREPRLRPRDRLAQFRALFRTASNTSCGVDNGHRMELDVACRVLGDEDAAKMFLQANDLLRRTPPLCHCGRQMTLTRCVTGRWNPFAWR